MFGVAGVVSNVSSQMRGLRSCRMNLVSCKSDQKWPSYERKCGRPMKPDERTTLEAIWRGGRKIAKKSWNVKKIEHFFARLADSASLRSASSAQVRSLRDRYRLRRKSLRFAQTLRPPENPSQKTYTVDSRLSLLWHRCFVHSWFPLKPPLAQVLRAQLVPA